LIGNGQSKKFKAASDFILDIAPFEEMARSLFKVAFPKEYEVYCRVWKERSIFKT
jgi:hypothetical protein